jgi:hypothetical protein
MSHPWYTRRGKAPENLAQSITMARSEKTTVMEDLLQEKRDEILRIAEKHGARNVRIFGSVATGDATAATSISS